MLPSESPNNRFKQFSAGFFDQECCFVVQNLPSSQNAPPIPVSVSVAEKMILRGLPTKPSTYLAGELAKYFTDGIPENKSVHAFIGDQEPEWKIGIKGDPNDPDNNPAKDFYEKLIPKYFKEYPFLKQLIRPECPSKCIIPNSVPEEKFPDIQYFDFFLDAFDLVIEIDGFSHSKFKQKVSDEDRDQILTRRGIRCVRITTNEVRSENSTFGSKINLIKEIINQKNSINDLRDQYSSQNYLEERYEYIATAIIRLQVVLLELIREGHLNANAGAWDLDIKTDITSSFNWAELACEDLFKWILPVSKIYNEGIKKPKFNIDLSSIKQSSTKSSKAINIDFRLFERWNDVVGTDEIHVRSDYVNKERYLNSIHGGYSVGIPDRSNIHFFDRTKTTVSEQNKLTKGLELFNQQLFGFKTFKEGQLEIISKLVVANRTLGLLPTGGGKSLCFQLTASLFSGVCIVVAPIVALMRDQVAELNLMGFKGRSLEITGQQASWEKKSIMEQISKRKVQFVFVSPERFQTDEFRGILKSLQARNLVGCVVVDEVHCLSEWGHDFRLSYLNLAPTIERLLPSVPIICLTATAAYNVLQDIMLEFSLEEDDVVYKMHNSRKELTFQVFNPAKRDELTFNVMDLNQEQKKLPKNSRAKGVYAHRNKFEVLVSLLDDLVAKGWVSSECAGIIFTPHVNGKLGCNPVRDALSILRPDIATGIFCGSGPDGPKFFEPSHSEAKRFQEMPGSGFEKIKNGFQQEFKENKLDLMCVTKAFGMGINKPNIRFTIHYCMPPSLEALYQEGGRAGRDGDNAECYVLFSRELDQIPDYIHERNTRLRELNAYCNELPIDQRGDFRTQLFMTMASQQDWDYERELCFLVLNEIEKSSYTNCVISEKQLNAAQHLMKKFPQLIYFKDYQKLKKAEQEEKTPVERVKINVQRYIFRLFQLGIVEDWTVEDFYKKIYTVKTNKLDDNQIVEKLKEYIGKYEVSNAERVITEEKISDFKAKYSGINLKHQLMWYLLKWNYRKFVYNRRQSLKNLQEACSGFRDTGPKKFKEKLDIYFRISKMTKGIDVLVKAENPVEMVAFIEDKLTSKGSPLPHEGVEKVKFSLARFLESYVGNPGLDLLSGICRLMNDEFENTDGAPRLVNFIQMSQKDNQHWDQAFENLLSFVSKLEPKYKDQFSAEVCPNLENRKDLVKVHEYLDDDFSAIAYLEEYNKQLERVI